MYSFFPLLMRENMDNTRTFYGKRQDKKHWGRAAVYSAGLHALVLAGLNPAIPVPTQTPFAAEVDRILDETYCTQNPQREQISPAEQQFIDGLVVDIQEKHLDSTRFGEFMVRSEVFVQNSETACVEQ